MDLNERDQAHCSETWKGLQEPCDCPECSDGCDCQNSEVIMTSIGYVEVFRDGDVVAFGQVIYTCAD